MNTQNRRSYLTLEEVKEHLNIKPEITTADNRLKMLIDVACQKVQTYIQGPVLVEQKTDVQDGTSANTLVTHYGPIRKVNEIRIDYNGDFTEATTIIDPKYNSIRGYDRNLEFGIQGQDIVVRNDGNVSIVGRLFIGSVVQSIQVKYEAGWAHTLEDVPSDLKYGTLLLLEHLYILRENRELNVTSKGTFNGQSYSKQLGMPQEVIDMLDPYVDHTFGAGNRPQKNTFAV